MLITKEKYISEMLNLCATHRRVIELHYVALEVSTDDTMIELHNTRIAELGGAILANFTYINQAEIEEEISVYSMEDGLPSMITCSPEKKKEMYATEKMMRGMVV